MLPVLSWEEHRAWDAVKSSYKFGFRRNGKLTINALLSKSCISHIFEVFCWSSESLAFPRETKILSKLFLRTWLARLGHFQPTVAARLSISKVQVERSFPRFTNRFWENDAPIVPSVYSPGFSVKTIASTRGAPVANSCLHELLLHGEGTWVNGQRWLTKEMANNLQQITKKNKNESEESEETLRRTLCHGAMLQ